MLIAAANVADDLIKEDNKGQQSDTPNKMEEDHIQHGINGIEKNNQTEAKLGKLHLLFVYPFYQCALTLSN